MLRTRKVPLTEIANLNYSDPEVRAELAAYYDTLLAPFTIGDYGVAEPEIGETLLAVRGRLTSASGRRGWVLAFVPVEGLVFHVERCPQ